MQYFTFLLALFNPVYSFLLALYESSKKGTGMLPIISFALLFSAISFCIDPPYSYDLYRHYEKIDKLKGYSFDQIIYSESTNYLVFNTYSWLINKFNLPKQLLTATAVLISYICVLSVFNDVKKRYLQYSSQKLIFISFVIMWLSIDFVFLSSGIRNLTANALVFFCSYHFLIHNNLRRYLVGSTIAFFIHPASSIVALLVVLSSKFFRFYKLGKYLAVSGLILTVFNKVVNVIISYVDTLLLFIPGYSSVYLDTEGGSGGGFIKSSSFNEIVANYLLFRLPSYIGILYLVITKPRKSDPLYFLVCIFVFALGLSFNLFTIYQRLSAFFLHLFALFIILEYVRTPSKLNLNYLTFYLVALIISSFAAIFANYSYLSTANEVLYKPLLFLLFGL